MFEGVERICENIFCILASEKRLGQSRESDVSSRQMALRPHNPPYGRLKMRIWRSRRGDVSMYRKAMQTNFFILVIHKSALDDFAEMMFEVGKWSWELINFFVDALKCDFVCQTMFEFVDGPMELIFCIQGIQERDLGEVAKVMFEVGVGPENS
jgi:hypothetical protein